MIQEVAGKVSSMIEKSFQVTAENYTMSSDIMVIGSDLLIIVTGGDAPHIGTITTVSKESKQQTVRFNSHHGRFHKDDVLSEVIIAKIEDKLPNNCVVISGVHVDHITQAQIQASGKMAEQLGEKIKIWLEQKNISKKEVVYKKI